MKPISGNQSISINQMLSGCQALFLALKLCWGTRRIVGDLKDRSFLLFNHSKIQILRQCVLHTAFFPLAWRAIYRKKRWKFKILKVKFYQAKSSIRGQGNYSANSARKHKQNNLRSIPIYGWWKTIWIWKHSEKQTLWSEPKFKVFPLSFSKHI